MSDTRKRYRDRATRLKRALTNEMKRYGQIHDGSGNRYLIGPLYVLADELDKALAHYDWYERNCADDIGEPIHYLYWALALHRIGALERANDKLLETTVQNIYLLPTLLGTPPPIYDMWHFSNMAEPDYLAYTPEDLVPSLTDQEKSWIQAQLESHRFCRVRDEYISTYRALKDERNVAKRGKILRQWDEFWARHANIDG